MKVDEIEKLVSKLQKQICEIGKNILLLTDNSETVPKEMIKEQQTKKKQWDLFRAVLKEIKGKNGYTKETKIDDVIKQVQETNKNVTEIKQQV